MWMEGRSPTPPRMTPKISFQPVGHANFTLPRTLPWLWPSLGFSFIFRLSNLLLFAVLIEHPPPFPRPSGSYNGHPKVNTLLPWLTSQHCSPDGPKLLESQRKQIQLALTRILTFSLSVRDPKIQKEEMPPPLVLVNGYPAFSSRPLCYSLRDRLKRRATVRQLLSLQNWLMASANPPSSEAVHSSKTAWPREKKDDVSFTKDHSWKQPQLDINEDEEDLPHRW